MWSKGFFFLSFLILMFISSSFAQKRGKLLQFSGIIQTVGSNLPVGYVTVKNISFKADTHLSNYQGYFSFVAHEGDTIAFSSVGYEPLTLVIPAVKADKFSTLVKMQNLITELPVVTPYPWASKEEFDIAFMALRLTGDDLHAIRRNLSYESIREMARVVPRTSDEIYNANARQNHRDMSNRGINQRGANPLLNPFAWGSLIQQISKGDQSRSKR